jgi:uncharacterized metal-binding protein YceD (DUF177 family)
VHINVRDILAESVGYNRAYKISGERPHLETVRLTQDIEGEITISRLDSSLLVHGHITTEIELECHRCLRTFNRPTGLDFRQVYAEDPGEDEFPISDDAIDLAPLLEQEILLHLPIKILHAPDCRGIENAAAKYTKEDSAIRLQDQARITKGK